MTTLTHADTGQGVELGSPVRRLLDASLVLAPLAYLALDCSYAARGWWDGPTGAAHTVIAALYGIAALKLVSINRGRLQAVLLVVALLGVVGNAGVGDDTVHVALGGNDLFLESGPATVFKMMGFFFPLTFLISAAGLRRRTPLWWAPLLAVGAVLFPIAHVNNISWLAILDAVVMLLALGSLTRVLRD
jgi:hypothetical protein